jgi:hypothetical protein
VSRSPQPASAAWRCRAATGGPTKPRASPPFTPRTRDQLADALKGLLLTLSGEELAAIEQAVPKDAAAGERYGPAQMKQLDSEVRA